MHTITSRYPCEVIGDDDLERASWTRRWMEFDRLQEYDDGRPIVVAEFQPTANESPAEWLSLRSQWLEIPPHPHVLDAIAQHWNGDALLIRYAALDWGWQSVDLTSASDAFRRVALWGAQLAGALAHVWNAVDRAEVGRFLRPMVNIDLLGDVRAAFLPITSRPTQLPEDAHDNWPRCDERTAVYVVGKTISTCCSGLADDRATQLAAIITRCTDDRPKRRFQTLKALSDAFAEIAIDSDPDLVESAWALTEEGIGWLELGDLDNAHDALQLATERQTNLSVARAGLARVTARLGGAIEPVRDVRPRVAWSDVCEPGVQLEKQRRFAEAVELYLGATATGPDCLTRDLAIARCQLAIRANGPATDYARRVLAVESTNTLARTIETRALLMAGKPTDALHAADAWLAVKPDDPDGHYLRGRAMLSLGRPAEARDAFDRAVALSPTMLEALLLGNQAARIATRTRHTVGSPATVDIEVPEHLAALRDALVGGRTHQVIPILEREEYAADGAAQLVLAECLVFDRRFEDALVRYDRAASLSSDLLAKVLIGKVYALVALERAVEALAELDAASSSGDLDSAELRATALRRLGLAADADHELARLISASERRSDIRVGRR